MGEEAGVSGARLAAPEGGGRGGFSEATYFNFRSPSSLLVPFPLEGSRLCDAHIVSVSEGSREGNLDGG